jgi:hypothetical protein
MNSIYTKEGADEMMKKVAAVILSVVLMVSLLPISALAGTWTGAPDIDLSVSVSSSTVTATVEIGTYTAMGALQFTLGYDKDKLEVAGTIPDGGIFPSGVVPSGFFTKTGVLLDGTNDSGIGNINIGGMASGSFTTTAQENYFGP